MSETEGLKMHCEYCGKKTNTGMVCPDNCKKRKEYYPFLEPQPRPTADTEGIVKKFEDTFYYDSEVSCLGYDSGGYFHRADSMHIVAWLREALESRPKLDELTESIFNELNNNGAELGDYSRGIIAKALASHFTTRKEGG